MKPRQIVTIIALCLIVICVIGTVSAWATDVQFESSDGVWRDSECGFKGRGFRLVVFSFESYKFLANKPDISLVRVTPRPWFLLFMWGEERNNPKWKVPYARPSGQAMSILLPSNIRDQEEIFQRGQKAYDEWLQK